MAEKKKSSSKKSTNPKKVMDVAKPGKTAPSASSRPVIVGHKPTVKDPMVSEEPKMPSNEPDEHKIEVKRSGPKVIAPLSPPEELVDEKESKAAAVSPVPEVSDSEPVAEKAETESEVEAPVPEAEPETPEASEGPTEEALAEPEASDEETEQPEEPIDEAATDDVPEEPEEEMPSDQDDEAKKEPKDKGSSIVDAVAGQAAKNKDKKDDKKTEELQKRLAEVEKLVNEKKYFVKTSSTSRKERKTRWAILLLSILILAAGYLVIDAQIVKNDYWLPYHFFKEEKQSQADSASTPPAKTEEETDDSTDSATAETKEYIDTAKLFSLQYPNDWTVVYPEAGHDGSVEEKDWTKDSRPFEIKPASGSPDNNVVVVPGCTENDIASAKAKTDQFHTQEDRKINGYTVLYDKVDFKGDAETYLDHNYYFEKGEYCLRLSFRERHTHEMSDTDFDDKANLPKFEAIVNSVKFLK